ncbi:MAG: NADH-quinone oxidoreductase subunit NuoN [gamma proteobacterium symbiont of Bathyaustriella thionipta]|nr:NADH-quinone oxidoreductase subunit NuoN [gamma proteobacterium symbiont of Bathyaustriella thionipta]MCU7948867.1 NADH-quinone oxidoreductase subunit NuoN [gamma proteobacterium symbiont of Bathyaustriella thionipta]MCU7951924.1 NADH-quinone oxidoreductase subunit NuoN [gamma proteobacterium symbiont of Bathyaustriella thionipta]MCU7955441.1 NADH-quinone oxidoreductase subunit NuoN [gamma proteobacterium symbiont of Bathyaustriella thionipta]MCU7965742.1 NADH-quinone oxidoreductase subunit 
MNFATPAFMPAMPEIFLLSMVCVIMIIDLFLKDESRGATYVLSLIALIATAFLAFSNFSTETISTFNGSFILDPMATILKIAICIIVVGVFIYAKDYLKDRNIYKGEYFTLGLFGVLGMMVMVSAGNFLTVYLGLELLSLSMYAMIAMQRDSIVASEAAMKYFILGAIASGMLLYGMSMVYGVTGSLDLATINKAVSGADRVVMSFGLVFIILGVAFKLGAVPFHMWMPDVYHGSPTSVTLYIASAPKIAAFAMMYRLLVDGLAGMQADWQMILIILSVLSMVFGNIIAIAQTNIKRMLAYSTISHVGFIIMGVIAGTQAGYGASMFYAIVYAIMSVAGFGMIVLLSRAGFEAENIEDFKGLNQRSPWFAFVMMAIMFSMAGVPPFLGFWAKIAVLQEAVNSGFLWLAIIGVMASVVGAFYYLRVVKAVYFDKPVDETPLQASMDIRLTLSLNGMAILALGLYPTALITLCISAFS